MLDLRQPAAWPAPFQEVREHLTFALHTDLPSAHKVVVVCDEAMDVFCYLKKETKRKEVSFRYQFFIQSDSSTLDWFYVISSTGTNCYIMIIIIIAAVLNFLSESNQGRVIPLWCL